MKVARSSKALALLAAILSATFVAQPAFALQNVQAEQEVHMTRALLQATTLADLVKPGGLVSSLLGPNGAVGDLVKNLNLDQVVKLIPVLQELENVLNRLALPGNVLEQLLGTGGVVDKLLGPTGSINGLLLGLGLSQTLQLTPVLLQLQAVLNTLAGPKGGQGAGSPGDGQKAVSQLMAANAKGPDALKALVGNLKLGRKLLQNDNELQNLLKKGGLVDLLLGPKGLVGDLITKLNLDQVIQILPVLAELGNVLRRLALPGNVLSQLLAPGGVVDKLLGPTGSVNGLLLGLGLSQALQLTPVLIQLQNVLNTLAGTGAGGASSGSGSVPSGGGALSGVTGALSGGGSNPLSGLLGGKTEAGDAVSQATGALGGGQQLDLAGVLAILKPLVDALGGSGGSGALSVLGRGTSTGVQAGNVGAHVGTSAAGATNIGAQAGNIAVGQGTSSGGILGRKMLAKVPLTEAVLAGRRME